METTGPDAIVEDLQSKIRKLQRQITHQKNEHELDIERREHEHKLEITRNEHDHELDIAHRIREHDLDTARREYEYKLDIARRDREHDLHSLRRNIKHSRLRKKYFRLLSTSSSCTGTTEISEALNASGGALKRDSSTSFSSGQPAAVSHELPIYKDSSTAEKATTSSSLCHDSTLVVKKDTAEITLSQIKSEDDKDPFQDAIDDWLFGPTEEELEREKRAHVNITATKAAPATAKTTAPTASRPVRVKNTGPIRQFGRARKAGQLDNCMIRAKATHYEKLEKQRTRRELEIHGMVPKRD